MSESSKGIFSPSPALVLDSSPDRPGAEQMEFEDCHLQESAHQDVSMLVIWLWHVLKSELTAAKDIAIFHSHILTRSCSASSLCQRKRTPDIEALSNVGKQVRKGGGMFGFTQRSHVLETHIYVIIVLPHHSLLHKSNSHWTHRNVDQDLATPKVFNNLRW